MTGQPAEADGQGPDERPDAADGQTPRRRPEAADGEWHRVHPISPWVRGWVILVAMLFFGSQSFGEDAIRALLGQGEFQAARGLWITLAVYAGVFVIMVVIYYFSWRFTKYQLADEQVLLDTGVIFRQHRRVRYDRVQAVDIRQPLLARIFGLAELKFEAADGGSTAMQLSFIKEAEARVLRAEIMGRAAGIRAGVSPETAAELGPAGPAGLAVAAGAAAAATTEEADGAEPPEDVGAAPIPEAPEQVMLQVPVGRMIGSLMLSTAVVVMLSILILMVVAAAVLDTVLPQEGEDNWWLVLLFALIPFAFSLIGVVWGGFNKGYNFTVATSPDGMRLRYGLLETSQQTVPPGRVQAVRVSQGLLWRPFGWYKMVVNVAGYGPSIEGGAADKSLVLPVGTIEDVMRVLSVVVPDPGLGPERTAMVPEELETAPDQSQDAPDQSDDAPDQFEDAPAVIREGITGLGDGHGFTCAPRRVWWLDPLTWRRNAYRSTRTLLMLRSGRLERYLQLIPHERIQSVDLQQGPLLRRLSVATLRFHSTPGPVAPQLVHADEEVAARLFLEEADIAAVSRRMRDRNQWMRQEELERFDQRTRQAVQQ
ncbi:PH domain-containing protein [Citricoccus sp. NPDC055426]|uniref:PH domain-containing protein n=1 Tax=Citricoccus sp. NPDC055426 TaxID=3155536 RepID=UPI0034337995